MALWTWLENNKFCFPSPLRWPLSPAGPVLSESLITPRIFRSDLLRRWGLFPTYSASPHNIWPACRVLLFKKCSLIRPRTMRIHFWDEEQRARLRKTRPPPECKNCNKPITSNNSRAGKDKKQPAKNVVTTHSLLNTLHTSMHRPNYFSAFPNPLCPYRNQKPGVKIF